MLTQNHENFGNPILADAKTDTEQQRQDWLSEHARLEDSGND